MKPGGKKPACSAMPRDLERDRWQDPLFFELKEKTCVNAPLDRNRVTNDLEGT